MIPISDSDQPRGGRVPIVTWALIAVNVLVFFYELTLSQAALNRFFMDWGAVPRLISDALAHPAATNSPHALLTLITSQFIHGGWLHIIGNMLFLWIFGDDIEALLGPVLYTLFYLVCGVVAGLTQTFVLARMFGAENVPGIGASGAIAGVLGAYIVLYPTRRIIVLAPVGRAVASAVPAFVLLGVWFLEQFFSGVASLSPEVAGQSNIGFWAHIGGFIAGLILILLILPFKGRSSRSPVRRDMYTR
jgi:membrane associated rhomboid family serine protease